MYHEHPLRILRYSMKNIWLLIFPLLRGVSVFHFDPAGIYAWIKGAWMDIAVLGVILLYGLIRWYFSEITLTDSAIIHKEGFFVRISRTIPYEKISAAASETPFYLIPLRAVIIRCDTRAGFFRSTDFKVMVTKKAGQDIMSRIPDVIGENEIKGLPRPNVISVLLFSVFFSSGFTGAVYIAAFFFKGGDIAHDIIGMFLTRITEQAEQIYSRVIVGIPKAAVAAGIFFIGAWALSFILNLIRYSRFRLSADTNNINIAYGLVTRRVHRIRTDHINYIDMRQNLIMKFCEAVTVNISCPGYGSDSNLPVLLPIRREKNLGRGTEALGIITDGKPRYRPKLTSFFSYAGFPAVGAVIVLLLYNFIDLLPSELSFISLFLVIMAEIPLIWLTMVKFLALITSGISVSNKKVVIRCSKMTSFHTVIADRENVVLVQLTQTIFQRMWKKCSVIIWLSGESRSRYKVKSLPLEVGKKIKEMLVSHAV